MKGSVFSYLGVVGGETLAVELPKVRIAVRVSALTNAYRKPFKNW